MDAHDLLSDLVTDQATLIREISNRATNPNLRVAAVLPGPEPAAIGPVITFLQNQLPNCERGRTYLLPLGSQMGKTMAARYLVGNLQHRNGLYLNPGYAAQYADGLRSALNTRLDNGVIGTSLVTALGRLGAGRATPGNRLASVLVLDELIMVNDENKGFINGLFQGIAADGSGLICIILTNKRTTAEEYLNLNGGKIRPFPGTYQAWDPNAQPQTITWSNDIIVWSKNDLERLIRYHFRLVLGERIDQVITAAFPAAGQSPGDVVAAVYAWIDANPLDRASHGSLSGDHY